jgi:hypothetical protein
VNDNPARLRLVTSQHTTKSDSRGHLEPWWVAWFDDGETLRHESNGTTVIHGSVVDQALTLVVGKVAESVGHAKRAQGKRRTQVLPCPPRCLARV